MKIAAGICEYGDPDGLYRCLSTLDLYDKDGVDLAIIVHGKFENFDIPGLSEEQALRDTLTIITKFPLERIELVIAENHGCKTEIDNRNLYLSIAYQKNCPWLMVIDSDEYIGAKPDWKTFRSQLNFISGLELEHQIFDIQFEGRLPSYIGPRPRMFYRTGSIKYWKRHYWFVLEETKQLLKGISDGGRIIGGICMMHDHTVRSGKYYGAALHYKEKQQERENNVLEDQQIGP